MNVFVRHQCVGHDQDSCVLHGELALGGLSIGECFCYKGMMEWDTLHFMSPNAIQHPMFARTLHCSEISYLLHLSAILPTVLSVLNLWACLWRSFRIRARIRSLQLPPLKRHVRPCHGITACCSQTDNKTSVQSFDPGFPVFHKMGRKKKKQMKPWCWYPFCFDDKMPLWKDEGLHVSSTKGRPKLAQETLLN